MPPKSKPPEKPKASAVEAKLTALTVAELRVMAKLALGSGVSKLRTKADLVQALLAPPQKPVAAPAAKPIAKQAARARKQPVLAKSDTKVATVPVAPSKPLTAAPKPSAVYDERLGELPDRYWDDSFVALPIGPDALFFYWDFKQDTEESARAGLRQPRAVLSLSSGGHAVEHIDFSVESRSYYVRSLAPGKTYEAEIFFVGDNGERRRLGGPSNAVTLPPRGVSPIIDDRFIQFLWGAPLGTPQHPYVAAPGGTVQAPRRGPLGSSPMAHGKLASPLAPAR